MSSDLATAFVERLQSDVMFQSRLAAEDSPAERLAFAREEGFDLSSEDVDAIKSALGIEELSDDDLEKVAGGFGSATTGSVIPSGGITASIAASSAAL